MSWQFFDRLAAFFKDKEIHGQESLFYDQVYTGRPNDEDELAKFTAQLGGVTLSKNKESPKKHILRYFR